MAKIILSMGDTVLQEVVLSKERITIGRRPHNDIVIDNLAISAEHAVIVTQDNDSFLEDLNSTNGTQVNGQPVKKHFLQDNDLVELAQYRLTYSVEQHTERNGWYDNNMPSEVFSYVLGAKSIAMIKVLNGANVGKETVLAKALTSIGLPGVQVAVIAQQRDGYYVSHVEGDAYPIVNGRSIGKATHAMIHGDVIDLVGTQIQFLLI